MRDPTAGGAGGRLAAKTAMPHIVRVVIEFDSAKDTANRAKHSVPLAFGAIVLESRLGALADTRRDYGEIRVNAFGLVDGRLFVGADTMRDAVFRVISVGKASRQARRRWQRSA